MVPCMGRLRVQLLARHILRYVLDPKSGLSLPPSLKSIFKKIYLVNVTFHILKYTGEVGLNKIKETVLRQKQMWYLGQSKEN